RVRQINLAIACIPRSVVWHRESSSTRRELMEGIQSPLKHYLFTRNRIATVRKHGVRRDRACFFLLVLPGMAIYYTLGFIMRKRWEKMGWFWRGVRDGLRGRLGPPSGYSG